MYYDIPTTCILCKKCLLLHKRRQMLSVESDNKYFRLCGPAGLSQLLTSAVVCSVKAATGNT